MGLLPPTATVTGSIRFDDVEMVGLSEKAMRSHRGLRRGDGVPGPDPLAESDDARRRADPRGDPDPREGLTRGRARPRARAARARPSAGRGGATRAVPPPALGRHAPARDDRDRAGGVAEAADRRRGHDRARRDDPGADHGAPARPAAAARDGADHDQPRPRAGGELRRRGGRDVRGAGGRAGADPDAVRPRPDAVHARAAGRDPAPRERVARPTRRRARSAAEPGAARTRVPVHAALPERHRSVPRARAGVRGARARAPVGVLASVCRRGERDERRRPAARRTQPRPGVRGPGSGRGQERRRAGGLGRLVHARRRARRWGSSARPARASRRSRARSCRRHGRSPARCCSRGSISSSCEGQRAAARAAPDADGLPGPVRVARSEVVGGADRRGAADRVPDGGASRAPAPGRRGARSGRSRSRRATPTAGRDRCRAVRRNGSRSRARSRSTRR